MTTLSPELESTLLKISSDWALHLSHIESKKRKAEFTRLLKRYERIYQTLEKRHQG
jgi:hypothetical protein